MQLQERKIRETTVHQDNIKKIVNKSNLIIFLYSLWKPRRMCSLKFSWKQILEIDVSTEKALTLEPLLHFLDNSNILLSWSWMACMGSCKEEHPCSTDNPNSQKEEWVEQLTSSKNHFPIMNLWTKSESIWKGIMVHCDTSNYIDSA